MLQPGTCSASSSSSSTCSGPPGEAATHAATSESSGGGRFGPPTAAHPRRAERGDEVVEPVGIDHAVGVGVGHDLAGRGREADVAGRAQALFS